MAVNPYTLNNLYTQGIIDYIPADLMLPTPVGSMHTMSNPYLNLAQQGGLYQQYGSNDSFSKGLYANNNGIAANLTNGAVNTGESYQNINNKTGQNGFLSRFNIFGNKSIGRNFKTNNANAFGESGIGTNSTLGISSANGEYGIGGDNQNGIFGAFSGFDGAGNNISNGTNKIQTIYNGTPALIKGLVAGTIIIGTLLHCFKTKKTPKNKTKTTFLSKLNPFNWFKKSKPKPIKKQSFWSKLNPCK